jgi:hypothetical protein
MVNLIYQRLEHSTQHFISDPIATLFSCCRVTEEMRIAGLHEKYPDNSAEIGPS